MKNDLEFYAQSADSWWQPDAKIYALYYLNQPRFTFFDRYVQNWQGLRVLDVGCGGGFSCEFMAHRGVNVSGIDQSSKCILKAQEHASMNGWHIDYRCCVAENLPYEDSSFDVVVCVDVLEHVCELQKVIQEIYRVLKPGGFFFFDTINRTFHSKLVMIWLLENILKEIPRGVHDWQMFIQPEELQKLLEKQGFFNIEIAGFDLFGKTFIDNLSAYFYYKRFRQFRVQLTKETSVMYIGKAVKR